MPTPSGSCPTDTTLLDFLKGQVDHHQMDALGMHLDHCLHCVERAEAMSATLERLPTEDGLGGSPLPTAHQAAALQLSGLLEPIDDPSLLGRISNFLVYDVIACGGMGIVLHAHDPDLKRDVAIKVLAPNLALHEEARERFLREARSAASINHEHVMPIYAVVRDAALPYLVMPLNVGGSLGDRLQSSNKLSFEEIVKIGLAVASGLASAHEKGLIHRDVKPANILLEKETGKVRLTDFGVALAAETAELTRTGFLAGTPAYMAPEQIDGEHVDHRADLFGLGVVLYTLVSGSNPFEANTTTATIKRVAMNQPPPLPHTFYKIPQAFQTLVDQLLEKLPQDRPQSANEVVARLRSIGQEDTIIPHRAWWKHPAVLLAVISTMAILALLVWTSLMAKRSSPETRRIQSLADMQLAREQYSAANYRDGLALLCRSLRADPSNIEATQLFMHELAYRPFAAPPEGTTEKPVLLPHVLPTESPLDAIKFTTGGTRLMAYGQDEKNYFWDTTTFELQMPPMKWPAGAIPVATADAANVSVFYWNGNRSYWFIDPHTMGFYASPVVIPEPHACAALSSDASLLLAGSLEGSVYLWDVRERQLLHKWHPHRKIVTGVRISKDNQRGMSISEDGTGSLFDLQTGQAVGSPLVHDGPIHSLDISEATGLIATGSSDNTAKIWSLEDARSMTPSLRHAVNCPENGLIVRFTHEGQRLLTAGSNDHTLRMWLTKDGQPATDPLNHPGVVTALDLDSSGTRLATGCDDGSVRIWHLPSARMIAPEFTLPHAIDLLHFSSNDHMAAATVQGLLHVYELAPLSLQADERLLETAEAIAGRRIGRGGMVESLTVEEMGSAKEAVLNEPASPKNDVASRLAHWLLSRADVRERSPFSKGVGKQ